jgi:hypothetical protein
MQFCFSLVKGLHGSKTHDMKILDSKYVQNNEISIIFLSMNLIYGREKSIFLFSFYVRKHPNAYRFTLILANETKGQYFNQTYRMIYEIPNQAQIVSIVF